jgi:hypothetical protein
MVTPFQMNIFFTFAFNIGRVPEPMLVRALHCLVKSLDHFHNDYLLVVYTNLPDLEDELSPHIRIVPYDTAKIPQVYPENRWWSMSFHKLAMAAATAVEYGEAPIWIDLDTVVCRNVDHLAKLPNFFLQHGTTDATLVEVAPTLFLPANKTFQGNIWKVDTRLLHDLLALWDTLSVKPHYDTQGLFNLAYYFHGFNDRMHILDDSVLNTLETWSPPSAVAHPTTEKLRDIVLVDGVVTHRPTGKPIQFLSFTFETLAAFFTANAFSTADPTVLPFFRACGYA